MDSIADERFEGPLVPDALLAEQFFAGLTQHSKMTGERRLMVAVLEDAVHCFLRLRAATDPKKRQLFCDAEAWISSTDRSWVYSFENLCLALDLEPEYVRAGLLAWHERHPPVVAGDASDPAPADEAAGSWEMATEREPDALQRAS